jgi:hypothetical protein
MRQTAIFCVGTDDGLRVSDSTGPRRNMPVSQRAFDDEL